MIQTIHHGDALAVLRSLPADSVHCIVTSPPYYGLRDYGTATWLGGDPGCDHRPGSASRIGKTTLGGGTATTGHLAEGYRNICGKCGAERQDAQIGMEPTIAAYVATMVEIFEECRRVLRPDGTLWLNLGDSYAGSGGAGEWSRRKAGKQEYAGPRGNNVNRTADCGLKPKDLIGIPWRVAFALQEAGWWLRADIIWAKKAPMPESVTDRPTRSHEHVFLLAKSSRYYYDADAVRETQTGNAHSRGNGATPKDALAGDNGSRSNTSFHTATNKYIEVPGGRHPRDVWILGPEAYPAAHFAVFPTEVPRRAILAGTSEKGCCPACGAPWKRVVDRTPMQSDHSRNHPEALRTRTSGTMLRPPSSITTGWQPGCVCGMPEGWQADDLEIIASPRGKSVAADPTLQSGRAGMNRPRGEDEGQRPITRGEQRRYARQLRDSDHRDAMAAEAGAAFAYYLRADRTGARPIPPDLLDRWIALGWLERVIVPAWEPLPPIPCTVLDPFLGSGTTLAVAASLGRCGIGIELNADYIELARQRIERQQLPLALI